MISASMMSKVYIVGTLTFPGIVRTGSGCSLVLIGQDLCVCVCWYESDGIRVFFIRFWWDLGVVCFLVLVSRAQGVPVLIGKGRLFPATRMRGVHRYTTFVRHTASYGPLFGMNWANDPGNVRMTAMTVAAVQVYIVDALTCNCFFSFMTVKPGDE